MTVNSSLLPDTSTLTMGWSLFNNHVFLRNRLGGLDHRVGVERKVFGFLVLLDQVAAATAPGLEAVSRTISLEIELLIDVVALHHEGQPVKAEVVGCPEPKARSVDGRPVLKGRVLPQTVVSLAKRDAGDAACDQASINGIKATKESAPPWLRTCWARIGQDSWLCGDFLDTVHPLGDIVCVNSLRLG